MFNKKKNENKKVSEKKVQKVKKPFTQEKFNNSVKALLFSYATISIIAAFSAHWAFGLVLVLCLVLFYFVMKRKPLQELPKELTYVSQNSIDISALPKDYQEKMQNVFVILYNDAKKNNRLVLNEVSVGEIEK